MSSKACVVCGADFDAHGSAKMCSDSCVKERRLAGNRAAWSAYYAVNRERERARANAAADPEKARLRQKKHRANNPQKYRAYAAIYRLKNPEKFQERQQAQTRSRSGTRLEYERKRRASNPEKCRDEWRRANIKRQSGKHQAASLRTLFAVITGGTL